MRLDWLRAFRAVMQTGTATGAAGVLLRTQPQVSRMIASLEQSLGLSLFKREGRRLVPTEQGLQFLHYVEPLLFGLDGMAGAADDIRHDRGRPLVIAAEPFLLHALVPDAIAAATADAPLRCSIDLCVRGLGLWMSRGNADLGIVALPFSQTDMDQVAFAEAEVVAVLPAGHRLAGSERVRMEDLAGERLIALRGSTLLRAQIDIAAARAGIAFDPLLEVASGPAACELVARGLGFTLADPIVARSFEARGLLTRPTDAGLRLTYGFLLPRGQGRPKPVARLMSMIAATAARAGDPFVALRGSWTSRSA